MAADDTAVWIVVLMLDVVNDADAAVMPALLLKMLPVMLPDKARVGNSNDSWPVD
jgi:hypothetical protein